VQSVTNVDCPTCGKKTAYRPQNPWRPFCSERCKLIDLGVWANEGYRIPVAPTQEIDDELEN
jgi:endogenous inhibitor of DNA gyrase (YacG/DUF329 family)